MNADRLKLVLDNYAAHFGPNTLPGEEKRRAAAACQSHFDLAAEDLSAMLHEAFAEATPLLNYAGSVQPLYGVYALAEHQPELLRTALVALLAEDDGNLDARQARMQHFAESCNEALHTIEGVKHSWEQNLRSAMALRALLRPGEDYLYKSTEARAFSDMVGFGLDVGAGSAFRLGNYYAMGDALVEVMRQHEKLSALLPNATNGDWHLLVYDLLMAAPTAKWNLFGDLPPLIKTRSRAGQATQERFQRIARMQMDVALLRNRIDSLTRQISELPTPELVGKAFRSKAFGDVIITEQAGMHITLEAEGKPRKMALPGCILQGFLIPQDEDVRARYEEERQLLNARHALEADLRNRDTDLQRLLAKP